MFGEPTQANGALGLWDYQIQIFISKNTYEFINQVLIFFICRYIWTKKIAKFILSFHTPDTFLPCSPHMALEHHLSDNLVMDFYLVGQTPQILFPPPTFWSAGPLMGLVTPCISSWGFVRSNQQALNHHKSWLYEDMHTQNIHKGPWSKRKKKKGYTSCVCKGH